MTDYNEREPTVGDYAAMLLIIAFIVALVLLRVSEAG